MKGIISIKIVRAMIVCGTLLFTAAILHHTFIYLFPFLLAVTIAFLLDPPVTYIKNRLKFTRGLATFTVMLAFLITFFLACYFIIAKIITESMSIVEQIPDAFHQFKTMLMASGDTIYGKLQRFTPALSKGELENYIDQLMDTFSSYGTNALTNIIQFMTSLLGSFSYSVFTFIFVMLAVFIITKDLNLFKQQTKRIVPENIHQHTANILTHVKKSFIGLLKAQIAIALISSLLFLIGLLIFHVKHAFALTLAIFIVDFIPYVGIGVILIPWLIYLFLTGQYVLTIKITILYIIVILSRQFLEPRLIASTIGIHPFIALAILFVGFQILGILGVILTPFILIVVSAFYQAGTFHAIWKYINEG